MASDAGAEFDQLEHHHEEWAILLEKLGWFADEISLMFRQMEMIGDLASMGLGMYAALTDKLQAEFGPEPIARIVLCRLLWQDNKQPRNWVFC